jgi:hypothetical protein
MKILYLAKEPGTGVRNDLSRISGEITIVDCLNAYGDYYRKMGYNCISTREFFSTKGMRFSVVIGNPPYGAGANDAIKFVNRSADFTDKIVMVLPRSFEKESVQNKVRLDLKLVESVVLPEDTFPNGIRAVKQMWVKSDTLRKKVEKPRFHQDFEFLRYEDRFDANVFIGEYGCGPSGRVKTENFTHYAKGHYFIRAKDQSVIDKLVSLGPKFREKAQDCNGRFHLSKGELVEIYSKYSGE